MGYVLRLTEENCYDTPSWIFDLADLKGPVKWGGWPTFYQPTFNQAALGLTRSELDTLRYGDGPPPRTVVFSHQPISVDFVRFSAPKLCPECLRQANYYRRFWDLLPVTACPEHEVLLIDSCQGCGGRTPGRGEK